jgi:hypothetical protein
MFISENQNIPGGICPENCCKNAGLDVDGYVSVWEQETNSCLRYSGDLTFLKREREREIERESFAV